MTVAKSAERSVLTVESERQIERVDSVVVEQRDTLREVTTLTIMTNDKGDTLKVTQVTERDQLRSRYDVKHWKEDVLAIRDTVYVVTRDLCIDSKFDVKASREINGFKAGFRVGFKVDNGYCLNPSCHGSARACTALMFGVLHRFRIIVDR